MAVRNFAREDFSSLPLNSATRSNPYSKGVDYTGNFGISRDGRLLRAIFLLPEVSKKDFGLTEGVPTPCDKKSAEAVFAFVKTKAL